MTQNIQLPALVQLRIAGVQADQFRNRVAGRCPLSQHRAFSSQIRWEDFCGFPDLPLTMQNASLWAVMVSGHFLLFIPAVYLASTQLVLPTP